MIRDPLTRWDDGPFPYDELAPAGITTQSSHKAIQDASFDLMLAGLQGPRPQRALQELTDLERRLVIDFLLYDVDLAAEIAHARERADPAAGEPAVVTDALSTTPGWLTELAAQIAGTVHEQGIPERPKPDAFPVLAMVDELIQFDR